jgi:Molybdopterin-guanine dinucleotide biosynthesis protein
MKIVGIVGWKNSGKTYFASKIINKLKTKNYTVASIKHAHHEFDIDHKNTDSYIHI